MAIQLYNYHINQVNYGRKNFQILKFFIAHCAIKWSLYKNYVIKFQNFIFLLISLIEQALKSPDDDKLNDVSLFLFSFLLNAVYFLFLITSS